MITSACYGVNSKQHTTGEQISHCPSNLTLDFTYTSTHLRGSIKSW